MTRTNIVLAAAAVVFAACCFVLFKDTSAQRSRVRALEAQMAELHREMMDDATASQSVTSDTPAPISEPPAQAAALPQSQSSTPAVTKPAAAASKEWLAVLADPAYRRARLAEASLGLRQEYPHVVEELGLSAAEEEGFFGLLAEQSLRENERAVKKQFGADQMEWRKELYAQAEKERRAFLGEERFRTWVKYVKSTEARAFVDDVRTQLATTSSPLREEQIKPLVKALASEHERHAAERQENYNGETSRGGQWTEATPAAQLEYMERRAALIEESLDRQQQAGEMYLDSVQQREFNAMLDRRRERARVELESFRALLEATDRRSRSR